MCRVSVVLLTQGAAMVVKKKAVKVEAVHLEEQKLQMLIGNATDVLLSLVLEATASYGGGADAPRLTCRVIMPQL